MNPVAGLGLRILLWLPICFAVWYFSSIIFVLPMAWMLDGIMVTLFPDVISGVQTAGNDLLVGTHLLAAAQGPQGQGIGDIILKINPLKYGYSVPLYTALVLAAPATDDWSKAMSWILGILVLMAAQLFGVGADIIKTLAFGVGEVARTQLDFSPLGYEVLALAYQFGYLILPSVTPILLWLWQFRTLLAPLTGWEEPTSGESGS